MPVVPVLSNTQRALLPNRDRAATCWRSPGIARLVRDTVPTPGR